MQARLRSLHLILALLLVAALSPSLAEAEDPQDPVALGCEPSPRGEHPLAAPLRIAGPLPVSVDLRAGLPPVGDQGTQNSCVGWAVGYYYKSFQEAREQWWSLDVPAHQFSPAYVYNQRPTANCRQDRGMTILAALRIVQEGAAPLSVAPYNPRDACTTPGDPGRAAAHEYRAAAFALVFQGAGQADVEQIKAHLAGGDPVVMAIPVYTNFRWAAPGRALIDVPPAGSSLLGGHAVLAVGYDPQGILIVNSWGTRWGEQGFARLTYDFVRRYAWEAWVMEDLDATPPTPPVECSLAPTPAASAASGPPIRLSFVWSGATDHGGSGIQGYRVYWGPNPEGEEPYRETETPAFSSGPILAGQTYYLRVQALDRSGNASPWKTLYTLPNTP